MEAEPSPFIRLYLDEDVHRRLAAALRLRRFDAISAREVDRWGLSDKEQLLLAAQEGRTLFTYNVPDYLQLHQIWLEQGRQHAGIIVLDQLPIGESIRRLLNL